jgi:tyrosinase
MLRSQYSPFRPRMAVDASILARLLSKSTCLTSKLMFSSWTVNLGPAAPVLTYVPPNPQPDGLGYNPRCIRRDVSSYISSRTTNDSDIANLLTAYTDIGSFQNRMQGDFVRGYLGVHAGGHYTCGGDPGGDFFTSPGDPYFFLHRESIRSSISHLWPL